jgi:hypothetical protein
MPKRHVVKPGDCIASIAFANGLFPPTVWDHPENAALKQLREDPNVLAPGDEVFVPDKEIEEASKATGASYRFRRKGVPSLVRVQLMDEDEPRVGVTWTLDVGGGAAVTGTTGSDGVVEAWVSPRLTRAVLSVETDDGPEQIEILLGHLDPIDTIEGVQGRLRNMGYGCDVTGELDESTRHAIELFQESIGHPDPSGELDDQTRQALLEGHGQR